MYYRYCTRFRDLASIADLADALRGIPRDTLVLIDTPDGPKQLRMVAGTRVAKREGRIVQHVAFDRYAIILHTER